MEAHSRVHGELLSVGLDVVFIVRPSDADSSRTNERTWLGRIAAENQIDAVIEITDDAALVAANVWVIEKAPPRIELSRIVLGPETKNVTEMLAIRAVEVLRSTFLEQDMVARQQRREPVAQSMNAPTTASTSKLRGEQREQFTDGPRFGIELGVAGLISLDGVGPAVLPLTRVNWRARPEFMLQAAFAGFGTRPTVASTEGSARITQQYGTLTGLLGLHSHEKVWPYVGISAGFLRTSIVGRAESPRQGHLADRWSFLTEGSAGVGLCLGDSYHLAIAAHVQLAAPYVAIHIVDSVVATIGRPSLAVTLTLGAWL